MDFANRWNFINHVKILLIKFDQLTVFLNELGLRIVLSTVYDCAKCIANIETDQ